ncbi:MAG: 6-phosphogluconolactonase [Acidimicrobiia bacterium]
MIHVLPDPESLAEHAADLLAEELGHSTDLALAGGSTPATTYRALARRPIDWERIDLWVGDERWVPPGHESSNVAMARRALGDRAARRLLAPPWAAGLTPHQAAEAYERLLADRFGTPRLSPGIVLLGIGDDAHTASLFPGTAALEVTDRDYVANFVPQHGAWRLTLSLPAIHRADLVVFLVAGRSKADALAAILEGDDDLPAALVAAGPQRTLWLVDEAAASALFDTEVVRP